MGRLQQHPAVLRGVIFALARLIGLVASQQSLKFPDGATPTNFQGFLTNPPGLIATYLCDTGTAHTTFSTFAGCCAPNQNCEFFTKCDAGTATRIDGSTYVCTGTLPNCYTMTIYESYPFAINHWSKIGCVQPGFSAHTVYREIVPTSGTTPTGSGTSGNTTPAPTGTQARAGQGEVTQTDSGGSKAWIAGAVIGPVAAVAISAFVAFWIGRRRGRKDLGDNSGPPVAERAPYFGEVAKHEQLEPSMLESASPVSSSKVAEPTTKMAELADTRPLELDSTPLGDDGSVNVGVAR